MLKELFILGNYIANAIFGGYDDHDAKKSLDKAIDDGVDSLFLDVFDGLQSDPKFSQELENHVGNSTGELTYSNGSFHLPYGLAPGQKEDLVIKFLENNGGYDDFVEDRFPNVANQTKQMNQADMRKEAPATKMEIVTEDEGKHDPHKYYPDAKFKTLYVLVTPEVSKQYGGLKNIQERLKDWPRWINTDLKRFDTGIAIEKIKVIGEMDVSRFENTRKIAFDRLNTEYGCNYLRREGVSPNEALFLGLIDEKIWGTLKSDVTDNINSINGIGYESGGGLIRIWHEASLSVLDTLAFHEVIGHGWGLSDRSDAPRDVMYNGGYGEGVKDTFVDAWKIKLNSGKKVNTC